MRHLKAGRRLGVPTGHRSSMIRNMVTSLMRHGRIQTTETRAKELRPVAERIITLSRRVLPSQLAALQGAELAAAKARRVHAVRMARRWIEDRDVLAKVFSEYAELFATRPGGYTRIFKLGLRQGDRAPMALIEILREPYTAKAAPSEGTDSDSGGDSEAAV